MSSISTLHVRYATVAECGAAQGPPDKWLSGGELQQLARWRDPGARRAWLAARYVAKQLVQQQRMNTDFPLASIEICSRNPSGDGIRPAILIEGRCRPWCLSISHTRQAVLVALCTSPDCAVGVDLTPREAFDRSFEPWWYTPAERVLAVEHHDFAPLSWAIKEAVYKACQSGEGFAPGRIEVRPLGAGNYACTYRGIELGGRAVFRIWQVDHQMAVVAQLASPRWHPIRGQTPKRFPIGSQTCP